MENEILKKKEDEKKRQALLVRKATLEHEWVNLHNLLLNKSVDVKYCKEYLERDQELYNIKKKEVENAKLTIENLKAKIPILESELMDLFERIEARKTILDQLKHEEAELKERFKKVDDELLKIRRELGEC